MNEYEKNELFGMGYSRDDIDDIVNADQDALDIARFMADDDDRGERDDE
jgi:Holliday junction resolvase RusA-like endonuclease